MNRVSGAATNAASGPTGATGATGATGPAGATGPTGPAGGISLWDSSTAYVADDQVIDRDGIWQAVGSNTNSRPISGNTDWTLVGGTSYVEVVLDPVALTTSPFIGTGGAGYVAVPAPGVGKWLDLIRVEGWVGDGVPWDSDPNGSFYYGPPSDGIAITTDCATDTTSNQQLSWFPNLDMNRFHVLFQATTPFGPTDLGDVTNKAITWATDTVIAGGTRSLYQRFFYRIVDITDYSAVVTYMPISAINQGTKTITTPLDASAWTGSLDVVGSTGNDGTYTIVSATFDTDHTDIVVTEAIPDATADGWVKQ